MLKSVAGRRSSFGLETMADNNGRFLGNEASKGALPSARYAKHGDAHDFVFRHGE
jgi:hypothetical protein